MNESRKYLACYIDVLGQKAAYQPLRRKSPDIISAEEWDEVMRVAGETRWLLHQFTNICQEIRAQAKSFYGRLSNIEHSIFSTITVEDFLKEEPKLEDWGVCSFSDWILMYVASDHLWAGLIFTTWLSRLAEHMVKLHARKISVRGAISIGEAFPVRGGSIVGKLMDALQIYEGSVAFYSRIVVSPEFRDLIYSKIRKREDGDFVDPIFWDYRDLLDSDYDGFLRLDYLSEHMLKVVSLDGSGIEYVKNCVEAFKIISDSAGDYEQAVAESRFDVSKTDIAWKYRYLQVYYAARIDSLLKASQLQHAESGVVGSSSVVMPPPINKPEEYYVCYLRVDKMSSLPSESAISKVSAKDVIGKCPCDAMSATVLSRFIGQFNRNRSEWLLKPQTIYSYSFVDKHEWPDEEAFCKKASELTIGVEQIGNYLLFYVRNQNTLAHLCFLACIQLVSVYLLDAMCSNHTIAAACVKGIGWEVEQDHLMGTCIEDAHKLLVKHSFYPRFMISPPLAKALFMSKSAATFLGKEQSIYEDVDGVFFWDYLSIINSHLYEQIFAPLDYVGAIEFVYKTLQKRFIIIAHKRQIDAVVAPRIRELHSLCIYLSHKLETYNVNMKTIVNEIMGWYEQVRKEVGEANRNISQP